jgi:hypothetical protein
MQPDPLKKDATIASVLPTLAKPEEYICAVLGNLSRCRKIQGNAHVRIGITGKGMFPSHKVLYTDATGNELMYGAFDQDRPFTEVKIHENTWSTASMTFGEVQSLLGEIRAYKPSKSAHV